MGFMTDRKRAMGLGSAKSGTEHHWHMQVSSVGLLILVPFFLFTFGRVVGAPYQEVIAYLARPFPAIVTALMLVVGFDHFRHGVTVAIEDYAQGTTRKALIIAMTCVSYGAMATGLFAIARLAL